MSASSSHSESDSESHSESGGRGFALAAAEKQQQATLSDLAVALTNLGSVHSARAEHDQAEVCVCGGGSLCLLAYYHTICVCIPFI
jgi:hypothetical protein